MSTRVVSESHAFGDDYTWVPSTDEFEQLQSRVNGISREMTDVSTSVKAVERSVTSQDKKIHDAVATVVGVVDRVECVKSEIECELTNGDWKVALVAAVKESSADFEKKIREVNRATADQISELVKHEMSARSVLDELKHMKELAVKEIGEACDAAKTEIESSGTGVLKEFGDKVSELRELRENLTAGTERFGELLVKSEEIGSRISEMRHALDVANNDVGALFEKTRQKGAEILQKIDESEENLSRLKNIDRRMKVLMAFMILVMLALCLFLCFN